MGSIDDIMQLCRLCLVKDQVNIPIFDEASDIRQTFLKINSCLPVKVSQDDNLPKKICDGCSYKLDMLYIFRNTSVDSEKQLLSWLNQAGLGACSLPQSAVKDGGTKPEIMVKQETFESTDSRIEEENPEMCADAHSYIIQQQKLPYQQEFGFGEASGSTEMVVEEPAPKRAKRAAAMKKHVPIETDEDELDTAMQITKAEEDDSDDIDQPDYVEAPSTSADDQPGPSGVGKGAIEAPMLLRVLLLGGNYKQKEYICDVCFRAYTSKANLSKHKTRHREKKFKCTSCPKSFITKNELTKHVELVHEKKRDFICGICSYATQLKHSLEKHIIAHHNRNFPFKCELCGAGYTTKYAFDSHHKVQHEGIRFGCPHCKKVFKSQEYLNTHLKRHSPNYVQETYTCHVCSKVIHTRKNFNRHVQIHSGKFDNFVCDVCGKSLTTLQSLKDHKKRHTGEKTFVCDSCGKRFTTRTMLITHKRVHTKEKPYLCNVCNKRFTQKPTLNIHMRYHTGERPYKCQFCSKGFVSKTLLKNHKCKNL